MNIIFRYIVIQQQGMATDNTITVKLEFEYNRSHGLGQILTALEQGKLVRLTYHVVSQITAYFYDPNGKFGELWGRVKTNTHHHYHCTDGDNHQEVYLKYIQLAEYNQQIKILEGDEIEKAFNMMIVYS